MKYLDFLPEQVRNDIEAVNAKNKHEKCSINRRRFLKLSALAGGGLLIECQMPAWAATLSDEISLQASAYIRINNDNSIVITIPEAEMGQGVRTSLAMIIAEDLEADWSLISVIQAESDEKKYGAVGTGGSGSIRSQWDLFRQLGTDVKQLFINAAAKRFSVSAIECYAENSRVIHKPSGKSASYGDLIIVAKGLTIPEMSPLKDEKQFKIIGSRKSGLDVSDITSGKAIYGLDVRLPGQWFAAIERAPQFDDEVKSFDDRAVRKIPGVKSVVIVPGSNTGVGEVIRSGIAVVAENTWAAFEGRKKLKVEWLSGAKTHESTNYYRQTMDKAIMEKAEEEYLRIGHPEEELQKSDSVTTANYTLPFLAHATMEPMNCVAHVHDGRCDVVGPTQTPSWAKVVLSKLLNIPKENININMSLLGGGFGRRLNPDFVVEAAMVSRQVKKPVQVVWSREDDMKYDFYRPCATHKIQAAVNDKGFPHVWIHRLSTPHIGAKEDETTGALDMFYQVPNRLLAYSSLPAGIQRGWWRGVHTTHTVFALESFMDELAHKTARDPLQYRLALIDTPQYQFKRQVGYEYKPYRMKAVLKKAAEEAGWGRPLPQGHGMGIACCLDHFSYAAQVMEVTVTKEGDLSIERVVVAADCGRIVNRDGAEAQMMGGVIQGLSSVLKEQITVANGQVQQSNFHDYPIMRINEIPKKIDSFFIESNEKITGLGEPSLPPVAPALANAIYAATGVRLRDLPFDLSKLV